MVKVRSFLVAALLAPTLAFAASFTAMNPPPGNTSDGGVYRVATALAVATTGTASSDELDLSKVSVFGISGSCTGSAPDVKLEWQAANVADTDNFVTTGTIIANVTGTITPTAITPPPSLYGRIKLTGVGSNGANTVCTLDVFMQGS